MNGPALAQVELVLLDRAPDPLRQGLHHVRLHVAGHDQELVSAPAHEGVRLAAGPLQDLADLHEDPIPRRVPVGVVDPLEPVEVDHHQGEVGPVAGQGRGRVRIEPPVVALHDRHVLGHLGHQEAAIGQSGQRVGEARVLELAVHLLELFVALGELRGAVLAPAARRRWLYSISRSRRRSWLRA